MEHSRLLGMAKEALAALERDTSVPTTQTKGELLDLIDEMQVNADAIEGDPDG